MENNQNIELTPKRFLKTISIIHLGLLAGQIMFAIVVFTQFEIIKFEIPLDGDSFLFIVPIVAVFSLVSSHYIYRMKIDGLKKLESLKDKLTGFQVATLIKLALLEGASLLGIIACMNSGNLIYLIVSGLIISYFITLRPSKFKLETELDLSSEEKSIFNRPDEIIR